MQRRHFLAAGGVSVLAPLCSVVSARAGGSVVLELFTSQGCSSCPPADALLGELVRRPGVIALAWHVDYWDRLGWRDPYSSHLATERQRLYAAALGTEVYTPALVINGHRMVVGSSRPEVFGAIDSATAPQPLVSLARTSYGVSVAIDQAPGPVSALLVSFEPEHETRIGAGENGGRVLREFNTVRAATTLGSWDGAPRMLEGAAPTEPGLDLAVLVQGSDLRVLGAAYLAAGAARAA